MFKSAQSSYLQDKNIECILKVLRDKIYLFFLLLILS